MLLFVEMAGEAAQQRGRQLLARVSAMKIEIEGPALPSITFSAGVAGCPSHATRQEQLLAATLYAAKEAGRELREVVRAPGAVSLSSDEIS